MKKHINLLYLDIMGVMMVKKSTTLHLSVDKMKLIQKIVHRVPNVVAALTSTLADSPRSQGEFHRIFSKYGVHVEFISHSTRYKEHGIEDHLLEKLTKYTVDKVAIVDDMRLNPDYVKEAIGPYSTTLVEVKFFRAPTKFLKSEDYSTIGLTEPLANDIIHFLQK